MIICAPFVWCLLPEEGKEVGIQSIINEIHLLEKKGFKEVTLLGQNVDSYLWYGGGLKKDYSKASLLQKKTSLRFNNLLEIIAKEKPKMRIRFSTSNPQDMSDEVIEVISKYPNIYVNTFIFLYSLVAIKFLKK